MRQTDKNQPCPPNNPFLALSGNGTAIRRPTEGARSDWTEHSRSILRENYDWMERRDGELHKDSFFHRLGLDTKENPDLSRSFYVGAVWASPDWRFVLNVQPKFPKLDIIGMFLACCKRDIIASKLFLTDNTRDRGIIPAFHLWVDEPPLPANHIKIDYDPIIALMFVKHLFGFCQRHLRPCMEHVDANLSSKVKGRILVHSHIRENLVRSHPERIYCRYQASTINTSLNQILRAALQVSWVCLERSIRSSPGNRSFQAVTQWLRYCRASLSEVDLVEIEPAELKGLRFGGALVHYRSIINMAKAVLTSQRLKHDGTIEKNNETMPFAINMSRLFELYAYGCFRDEGWEGDDQRSYSIYRLRPDAIMSHKEYEDGSIIIDFKYKSYSSVPDNDDRRQIVEYAALKQIQETHDSSGFPPKRCLFVYPDCDENDALVPSVHQIKSLFSNNNGNHGIIRNYSWLGEQDCRIGSMKIGVPLLFQK